MEVKKISCTINNCKDEDDDPLPGFRFHPTDEELVWFYLRRKIENRPIGIELIKEIDIYKHDPWDLPKASNVGDKEWYFFCKRGRKYRNSIRPNRVTGSGFWKATGIDRSIYSAGGEGRDCIGLKKSLVYYRGSAGKGTKTDWMMHEFRLPAPTDYDKAIKHIEAKSNFLQEAEVWTLCRIVKRNAYKKCIPDWKDISTKKVNSNNMIQTDHTSSKTSCSTVDQGNRQSHISFNSSSSPVIQQNVKKPYVSYNYGNVDHATNQLFLEQLRPTAETMPQVLVPSTTTSSASYSSLWSPETTGDWNDIRSIVEYGAHDPFFLM